MASGMLIRRWLPNDCDSIQPMIFECLHFNYECGAHIVPSPRNITVFWQLGLRWSQTGEPTLLADDDGQVRGYVMWGSIPSPELDVREPICHGLGTYIVPEFRRHGLATDLRTEALKLARALGYKRVSGVAHHIAGQASVVPLGFQACGVQMEVTL